MPNNHTPPGAVLPPLSPWSAGTGMLEPRQGFRKTIKEPPTAGLASIIPRPTSVRMGLRNHRIPPKFTTPITVSSNARHDQRPIRHCPPNFLAKKGAVWQPPLTPSVSRARCHGPTFTGHRAGLLAASAAERDHVTRRQRIAPAIYYHGTNGSPAGTNLFSPRSTPVPMMAVPSVNTND